MKIEEPGAWAEMRKNWHARDMDVISQGFGAVKFIYSTVIMKVKRLRMEAGIWNEETFKCSVSQVFGIVTSILDIDLSYCES